MKIDNAYSPQNIDKLAMTINFSKINLISSVNNPKKE